MENEWKKETQKQYLHYFRFWFLAAGIMFVVFLAVFAVNNLKKSIPRGNNDAPAERVYDYAGVLTDQEEDKLRKLIAKKERQIQSDIVLVTINEAMESPDVSWENAMMNYADDFYDNNNYGYDIVHGDGVLLLDNWYEGQKGSWLSTCGAVYLKFRNVDVNQVLQAVTDKVDANPYAAYKAYIEKVSTKMSGQGEKTFPAVLILVIPAAALIVFVSMKLVSQQGKKSVGAATYVAGGRPVMRAQSDQLVRKFVTTRHIERSSGSTGGGSTGGGGGHVSSGGVSHGGGGMRR